MASNGGDDDDDIEALASKACALASVPIPDYAGSIKQENIRSKAKYGNRFNIGDDEEGAVKGKVSSSDFALAEKTSQILSNFEDYVTGIGDAGENAGMKEILEGGGGGDKGEEIISFGEPDPALVELAAKVRGDNKKRLMEGNSSGGTPLQREWAARDYGGHKANSTTSSDDGRNLHDPTKEWNDIEDGNVRRGQKYTHPLLESKRVKLGALNCLILAAIVFGVSIGVSNRNSKSVKEMGDKIVSVEEELAGKGGTDEWYANYDWTMDLPTHPSGAVGTAVKHTAVPELTDEESKVYQETVSKYMPITYRRSDGWNGRTYLDAYEFCLAIDMGPGAKEVLAPQALGSEVTYDICPYDAVCPLGVDSQPLVGHDDLIDGGVDGILTPISDDPNDWVQVSSGDNICVRYSAENEHPPEWGVKGDEIEDHVPHITCCLSLETLYGQNPNEVKGSITGGNLEGWEAYGAVDIRPDNPDYNTYMAYSGYYGVLEFDRSNGWEGKTFIEALQFCGAMDGYEVCPYEAICPLGQDTEPMGGYRDDTAGQNWAPVLDGANDWVSMGKADSCIRYSHTHGTPPEWSTTGIGSEGMTRHILCCLLGGRDGQGSLQNDAPFQVAAAPTQVTAAPAQDGPGSEEEMLAYQADAQKNMPVIFNREQGWAGQTYADAVEFCEVQGRVCPYEAICPLGPGTEPIEGYFRDANQMWVPIEDTFNDWVQLTRTNACLKFSSLNPGAPEWGLTGEDNEEFTRFVVCCADVEEEMHEDVYDVEHGEAYAEVSQLYQPIFVTDRANGWEGQTYVDAMRFCGRNEDGRSLCPYEAICPLGPGTQPLGGHKDGGGGEKAWYPVLATESGDGNEWVQISSGKHSCELIPTWGVTGENNEEMTRNIVCCNFMGGNVEKEMQEDVQVDAAPAQVTLPPPQVEPPSEEELLAYQAAADKYMPTSFNREQGWAGQTYADAVEFCKVQGRVCPYEAICPLGPRTEPIEGYLRDANQMWAPIEDTFNDWVQLTWPNACLKFSSLSLGSTEWGFTGEDNEELTRLVMCCADVEEEMHEDVYDVEHGEAYAEVSQLYQPIMVTDRANGWEGQTYVDAMRFCGRNEDGRSLCPYEAICPLGPGTQPLGGHKDGGGGEKAWYPVLATESGDGNEWVQISSGEHSCELYSDGHSGDMPTWGLTGENDEEMTRNIVCCNFIDGGATA